MKIIKLNEAFSPSMPSWLKDKFQVDKAHSKMQLTPINSWGATPDYNVNRSGGLKNSADGWKTYQTTSKKFPTFSSPMGKQRGAGRSDEYNIWDWAMVNGLDINNANFISGPIPDNARDSRLKAPNIAFWHLKNKNGTVDEVYATGINDNATSVIFGKLFKQTNPKQLKEHAVDFCYLDEADRAINFTDRIKKKQDDRYAIAQQMDTSVMRDSDYPELGTRMAARWGIPSGRYADASGYRAIKAVDKYAEILKQNKLKNLIPKASKLIDELKDELEEFWREYPGFVSNFVSQNPDRTQEGIRILSKVIEYQELGDAEFENARYHINELQKLVDSGDAYYSDRYAINIQHKIESARRYIENANKLMDQYRPAFMDWDAEEVEWEDF